VRAGRHGKEPVGWQRWRRQRVGQTWDLVLISAEDAYGDFHIAEFLLLLGVNIKGRPPTNSDKLCIDSD
jgi:hypothetical protein